MLVKLKLLLGIDSKDTDRDELLQLLLDMATERLMLMIGEEQIPPSLETVIIEAAVSRFNRVGSEGLTAHTVEGETLQFADDDFAAYADDIQAYIAAKNGGNTGKVRFL